MNGSVNGSTERRHWLNLHEITNLDELTTSYRLLEVHNVSPGDHYDKCINQLQKQVAYELASPVALIRCGELHCLAIPADGKLPCLEQQLMPHVARLVPREAAQTLAFGRFMPKEAPIATTFLSYALRTPLMRNRQLWGRSSRYFQKVPINSHDHTGIDIYSGFVWNVVTDDKGHIYVAVDIASRYVDRRWLSDRLVKGDFSAFRGRHCLYHYGHEWYVVQLGGLTGMSISEQRFIPEGSNMPVDVLTYTRNRWHANPPPWVRDLKSDDAAIIYRYPGNRQERHGALSLCKLTFTTADPRVKHLHRHSIIAPDVRFQRISTIVREHFQSANIGGVPIKVATDPLEVPRRVFPVPALRFGHAHVLAVGPNLMDTSREIVSLKELGRRRLQLVTDPSVGPLSDGPFDAQYLVLPNGLPREINEDFARRFRHAMQLTSGEREYPAKTILYDDRGATLAQQVRAIERALTNQKVGRGYVLFVLPEWARPELHNVIKQRLWPNLQIQCASAAKYRSSQIPDPLAEAAESLAESGSASDPPESGHLLATSGTKLRSFYGIAAGGTVRVLAGKERELSSYVRNCALAMLVVNRRWSWAIDEGLEHDVHIGVDVLNGMAGLTFVYDGGRRIHFRNYRSGQKERLSAALIREAITRSLEEDLEECSNRPRSILIQRDGRAFPSERRGVLLAIRDLVGSGRLPRDVTVGIVDIRKTISSHLRVVDGPGPEAAENPDIGSFHVFTKQIGILNTTGWPFRIPGTANPLYVSLVEGSVEMERVLKGMFALSQLVFTAPDKCMRLPLTIKLTDDFLEPIAADADEEAALYDEVPDAADTVEDEELWEDQDITVGAIIDGR